MRIAKLVFPVLLTLALSACSGTWHGMQTDAKELAAPVTDGTVVGYRHGPVLKPPALQSETLAPPEAPAAAPAAPVVWNDVGDYRQWLSGGAPAPAPAGMPYNADVSVFALDGMPGEITAYDPSPYYYGGFRQQVYFAHASAKIKKADAAKLHKLARRAKKARDVSVTVVGHASRRVDRVKDPLKKKMINLAMAQKRANAVTRELKKGGLRPAWVQAVSKGDEEPNPAPPPGMSQEAADRRAEIYMDEK